MDKNYNYLSLDYPENAKFVRLADDALRQVTLAPKEKFAIGRDSSPCELQAALNGQGFEDIYVINPKTGTRKLALSRQPINLTQSACTSSINTDDDHNVTKPPMAALR